ncbi:MAG: DUF2207 domain-containing protein [Nitratireductor sp.]|nr:DUF2207 domain-containing protein [Nitratireductor sp.]
MRVMLRILFFFALLTLASGASAQERITSFNADITVNKDASLDVVETIKVVSFGQDIRRGIFRDIPMRRVAPSGLWDKNGFSIRSIRHNGEKSPYHTEWQGNFIRIYIGDADVLIPPGEHTYEIAYRTTRHMRFFEDFDELYWNVTGNFWTFPIMAASATVRLPEGAVVEREAAYTGAFGATGRGNYRSSGTGRDIIGFETTRPLAPQEGLTIAVGFTKGVIAESAAGNFLNMAMANAGAILFAACWLFVPLYYLFAWWRVGRDPPGDIIIPLFHPPDKLSPAAMSFVHFKSFRQAARGASLAFIAALLSLGVKKLLVIDEEEGGTVVFKHGKVAQPVLASLPAGERSLYIDLLNGREELALTKANGPALKRAHDGLQSTIRREYAGRFYRDNMVWFAPGAIVAAIGFVGGLILQQPPDEGMATIMPAFFAGAAGCGLMLFGWRTWTTPAGGIITRVAAGLMLLLGAGILAFAVQGVVTLAPLPVYQAGAVLVLAGLAAMAAMLHLIGSPTLEGAKVLSRIDGFKLYLTTAETNRLNMRDAPQMSEELFERYLPYAAGLGVEEPWSKAFAAHLSRVDPGREHEDYRPDWYRGRRWDQGSITRAATASVAAVSAAMASSMPAPKSSSGSSGGGFSGGGGGGGGGGGW